MRLTRRAVEKMAEAARRSRPEECCGIVLAEPDDPGLGTRFLPSDNRSPSDPRHSYQLDHRMHIRAVEAETQAGAVILAYCHSHPMGPASPSPADAALACPGVTYLIVGLAPGLAVRAWKWTGERFDEESVRMVEEGNQ